MNSLGDVKRHPCVAFAGHQIHVRSDVNADVTTAALGPVVGAVVGGSVGRSGPVLVHGADSHGHIVVGLELREQLQRRHGDASVAGLRNVVQWHLHECCRIVSAHITHSEGGRSSVGLVSARAVLDDVRVHKMRDVKVRKRRMVHPLHGRRRAADHRRGEVREMEVEGVGPSTDLVGRRDGTNPPVPSFTCVEGAGGLVGEVRHIETSVVPRRSRGSVGRIERIRGVHFDNVATDGHGAGEVPRQVGLGDRGLVNTRTHGPRAVEWGLRNRVCGDGIGSGNVDKAQFRAVGGRGFSGCEVRRPRDTASCTDHADDEVHATFVTHGALNGKRNVPFHLVVLIKRAAQGAGFQQRTPFNALCTRSVPGIVAVVTVPGGVIGGPVVLLAFPHTDDRAVERRRGEGQAEVSGLNGVPVRQQVGQEVAAHQGGHFCPDGVVVNRHFAVAIKVVRGGTAVNERVVTGGVLAVG